MTSLSRFSTPRWHHCKLMSTHTTKIYSISICEPRMPKIYHAKKSTFENLDSLTNHQIKGSMPSTFSTLNLQNKDSSTLKRPLVSFYVEAVNPNNPIEIQNSSSDGRTKLAAWSIFKNPITTFNKGITTNSSYCCTNMATWSLLMESMPLKHESSIKSTMLWAFSRKKDYAKLF